MPTGELDQLSDDDEVPLAQSVAEPPLEEKKGGEGEATEETSTRKSALKGGKGKTPKSKPSAKPKSKKTPPKPAAVKTKSGSTAVKAKAKSNAKKSTPKTKKNGGGKEDCSDSEIADEVVPEAIPAPKEQKQLKRPAAAVRRPAASVIVALKYKYHKLNKWGVRIKNGSEILTVTSLIQLLIFFEDPYPIRAISLFDWLNDVWHFLCFFFGGFQLHEVKKTEDISDEQQMDIAVFSPARSVIFELSIQHASP